MITEFGVPSSLGSAHNGHARPQPGRPQRGAGHADGRQMLVLMRQLGHGRRRSSSSGPTNGTRRPGTPSCTSGPAQPPAAVARRVHQRAVLRPGGHRPAAQRAAGDLYRARCGRAPVQRVTAWTDRPTSTWPSGSPSARPAAVTIGLDTIPHRDRAAAARVGRPPGRLRAGPRPRAGGPGRPGCGISSTRTRLDYTRIPPGAPPARAGLGRPGADHQPPPGAAADPQSTSRWSSITPGCSATALGPGPARLRQPGALAPDGPGAEPAHPVGHGRDERPVLAPGAACPRATTTSPA